MWGSLLPSEWKRGSKDARTEGRKLLLFSRWEASGFNVGRRVTERPVPVALPAIVRLPPDQILFNALSPNG